MATSIGRLVLDMAADAAGFERDMSRISKSAKKELNQVSRQLHFAERDLEKARSRVNRLSAAIAGIGAAGIAIAGREFRKFAQEADALDKVSRTVSLTVEELQELRFAAEQAAGITSNTLDMAMQRFARRVGEAANDTGELNTIVKELGVELRNADGSLKSQTELLGMFADEIQNAGSQQEALRIAFKLFDSEGAKMVALMRQGSGAVEELREQFRQTGATITSDVVEATVRFNDSLDVLSKNLTGIRNQFFADLIEPLSVYAEWLATTDEGQRVFRQALAALGETAKTVGIIIGVGLTAALGKAIFQMAVAEVRVASLTRQKLLLAGASRSAALGITAFQRGLSIATGPIGIAVAAIGTIGIAALNARDKIGEFEQSIHDLRLEMRAFLNEAQALDAFNEFQANANEARAAMADLERQIADTRRRMAEGTLPPQVTQAQAQAHIERLTEELERQAGEFEENSEKASEAYSEYIRLGKEADKAADGVGGLGDASADTAPQIAEVASAGQKFAEQLEGQIESLREQQIELKGGTRAVLNYRLAQLAAEGATREEIAAIRDLIEEHEREARALEDLQAQQEENEAAAKRQIEWMQEMARRAIEAATGMDILGESTGRASAAQDRFSRSLAQSLATAISAADGRSLGESLGASLRAYGTEEIQEGIQDALTRAMEAIGVDAENQGSAIAVASLAIGQAVGGQMGAAIGTALGAAIGSVIPGIGTALGAAIGGLIGGLFDGGSVPKFQVRGPDADRAISEGTDFVRSTALVEELQFAFRELNAEVQREVEQAFLGFDRAMAGIIRDAGQLEEIEEALREFAVSSRSDGEDLETLLQMRFDAIMGTFDEAIQAVVEQGLTLEEQVQRLAEVLAIEREMDFGRGLGLDGLESTLDALMALEIPGEQLGETFVRIRDAVADLDTALAMTGATIGQTRLETLEFAAGLTEAFGNTERLASVWDTIFETFYSEGERAAAEAGQARNVAETLLDQLGIELTDELATESGFRELLDELMPTLDPEDLAILLEAGEAIARLIDAEDRLADARGDSLSELDQFMAGIEDSILEIMSPNRLGLQQLREAQDEQLEQAAALGASEMQLMRVRELHALQNLQFTAALQESINSLAESLAESLHGTADAGQQFQDLGNTAANSANQIRDAFISALESIEDWIAGSQLAQFSPLTPQEQLNEAQAQFDAALAAALGGDVDAMGDLPGLADALLGQASSFFGTSTSDFQAIWDAVQAAMGQVSELEPPPEQTVEQQIAGSTQSTADNTWEQVQQAMQLIDEIGLLAGLTGELPSDIAADLEEQFGLSMADLIQAIGGEMPDLDGQAIEDYFNDLVTEAGDQATELADLAITSSDQLDATERIRDLAEDQLSASHEIRDILETIASGGELEQFAEGGPVTATGPALVHAGEFVVPQGGALVQSGSSSQAVLDRLDRIERGIGQGNEDRRLGIRTSRDGDMAIVGTTADLKREIARNRLHSGSPRRKPALT